MDNAIHKGHRERMRQRFLSRGFDGFSEHEILELLLYYAFPRRDVNPLAHAILAEYQTLANVFEADPLELAKFPGLSDNSATLLTMIPKLSQVYENSRYSTKHLLHNTESLGKYAVTLFKGKVREEFALISLDSNRRVRWSGIIHSGTIDKVDASPRIVVEAVVRRNAKTVVFAHNHPNSALMPSIADKHVTKQLVDVLNSIGVATLDHIIVSGDRYYSMAEAGIIF